MNGAAPKLSKIGSQVRVQKKFHPNFVRERYEVLQSSYTSIEVMRRIEAANTSVTRCVISSPCRNRSIKARGPDLSGASRLMNVVAVDISILRARWPSAPSQPPVSATGHRPEPPYNSVHRLASR